MTRGDVLHALGTLFADSDLDDRNKQQLAETARLTGAERTYVEYCASSGDPGKRSYDDLRAWLKSNVERNRGTLKTMLARSAQFLADRDETPTTIFDVGAGHDAWVRLLQEVWPSAQVFAVDRFKIPGMDYHSIEQDAVEFLETFKEEEPTLLFLSEFVHCKPRNLDVLSCHSVAGCAKLIVELDPSERAIDDRLRITGGGLLDPLQGLALLGTTHETLLQRYESTFRYYSLLVLPEEA